MTERKKSPLKIAVLSTAPKGQNYSVNRLIKEGEAQGHHVDQVNFLECDMIIRKDYSDILHQGKSIKDYDIVIPRVSTQHTFFGVAIVRQFEMMGVYSLNGSLGISRAKDKLRSLQILARKGFRFPVSSFSHDTQSSKALIDNVGGAPVVIKMIEGMQGIGVVLAETVKAAQSVVEAFKGLKANIIVQEFVKEAAGEDIRCFVVGEKVVASMMRKAAGDEFRANIHRGGSAMAVKLTKEERQMAVQAAKEMKLNMAGVDLIRSDEGPMILEVNSSPGLEGIEGASKVNVAGKVIEFLEKNFPKQKKKKSHTTI